MNVAENLERIANRVADAGGDMEAITLVAVTKGFAPDAGRAALAAGIADLGENYAQELLDKVGELGGEAPRWHFTGRLQSNKVKLVAEHISCWQTIDRSSLVGELAKRAPGAHLLVQVNAAGEHQKGGAAPGDVAALVAEARAADLVVDGLMTIGVDGDLRATEVAFRTTVDLADQLGLRTRSFGMSADLALAARSGTTMVRIGTALFGPRPTT